LELIDLKSLSYYLFVLIAFFIMNLCKGPESRKKVLAFLNLSFIVLLFYYRKKHLLLLFFFLGTNYLGILALYKQRTNKFLTGLLIGISLIALCFYKYSLVQSFFIAFFPLSASLLKPISFIGISFFSFKLISLVVDTAQGKLKEKPDFFHYINYLLFFPCYLSGPLDRFDRFIQDANISTPLGAKETYLAVSRIIFGLFKKALIADSLYGLSIFGINNIDLAQAPTSSLFLGSYLYAFVLYLDFSGYSDIAIGISRLLGIKTPENFNNPFMARNIQEFWNRWHISFIHWLRDYIYFPLQMFFIRIGFKNFVAIAAISYIITFVLAGIWHGDKSIYLWYGLCHGLALAAFQVYSSQLPKLIGQERMQWYQKSTMVRVLATLTTFHFFVFSLIIFIEKTAIIKRIFSFL
tara:strand:- start:14978 stop:16201 length:1224 start_codon:yes stop_codon:yes gene_type:complete